MQLTGLHHLTAVTAQAARNHAFYTGTLGLRLVKKTVNQDDVGAYHLFYADGMASPGTDITFFDWPVPPEVRGTRSIVRTALRVAGADALAWWAQRLSDLEIPHRPIEEADGRLVLAFEDFEGQRLALIDDEGRGEAHPWAGSSVPAPYQIRGLGPVTLSVSALEPTAIVLSQVMNMRRERSYADGDASVHVFAMGEGGPGAELHVREDASLPVTQPGAGSVHHVAFRTPDEAGYEAWAERLRGLRVPNSGPVDRYYFKSLYFREPNGILFEIATDGPGFATDEPLETLGQTLALPPFLEPRRAEIEDGLKPL